MSDQESAYGDSFWERGLSAPSYTRPPEFRGFRVPDVLLSGDHGKIARWRISEGKRLTRERSERDDDARRSDATSRARVISRAEFFLTTRAALPTLRAARDAPPRGRSPHPPSRCLARAPTCAYPRRPAARPSSIARALCTRHARSPSVVAPRAACAQTLEDAELLKPRELNATVMYGHDAWDQYWEGDR